MRHVNFVLTVLLFVTIGAVTTDVACAKGKAKAAVSKPETPEHKAKRLAEEKKQKAEAFERGQ